MKLMELSVYWKIGYILVEDHPPHIQTREFEAFYIIEGKLDFNINGKKIIAKTGTVINIPPNIVHNFRNNTHSIVRMLIIISPAGLEKMFEEFGKEVSDNDYDKSIIKSSKPSSEEKKRLVEICKKYGVQILE